MSYFDYDFASLAIECGSHSDYVECQFSHALTPIRKVPPSATSGRLVTITPLTTDRKDEIRCKEGGGRIFYNSVKPLLEETQGKVIQT